MSINKRLTQGVLNALSIAHIDTSDDLTWSFEASLSQYRLTIQEDVTEEHFCTLVQSLKKHDVTGTEEITSDWHLITTLLNLRNITL